MGKDIRSLRLAQRLSQRSLAEAIGVGVSQLSKWERGLEQPSEEAVVKVALVLDCSPDELMRAQWHHAQAVTPGEGYTTSKVGDSELLLQRSRQPSKGNLQILDLFAGAGGLSHGFEMIDGFQVTCGIDLLPVRIQTFHQNHPFATAIAADIRSYSIEKLGAHSNDPDVIIGGPPCQGFSSLRPFRNLTENDNRNSLIEYFLLVVGKLRPKWFLFENVVGLLTHGKGKVLESLLAGFREAGYSVDWRILNAARFGVPQYRERIFIVGNRVGKRFTWPSPSHMVEYQSMAGKRPEVLSHLPLFDSTLPPSLTVMDAIHDLPEIGPGEAATSYLHDVELTSYEQEMRCCVAELTLHEATAHAEKMMEIIRLSGANRWALPDGVTNSGFSSSYSRLEPDKPSTTLTVNFVHPASNRCIHPFQDRALTPREGARLQSFPDRFTFYGNRTQIVKQIGNAVPPLLARAIASAILDHF